MENMNTKRINDKNKYCLCIFWFRTNIGGRRQEVRQWLRGVSDAYGAMVSESNLLIVP